MSTDYLVKALAFDGVIRAYAVRSTDTVGEVQQRHQMWPTATAALGRTISASVMMGAMLKGDNKLTVKIQATVRLVQLWWMPMLTAKCAAMPRIRRRMFR